MKLELIVPSTKENLKRRKKALVPPLGMAIVAALTPPEVDVSLTDENVTSVDFEKEVDLVGITALTHTVHRAYKIADSFRTRGVKVVMGGIHPSVMPEEASQHADAVVVGEAEGIWGDVIEDFKANKLRRIYRQNRHPSLVGLPIPRRDLYDKDAYHFRNTLWATRGCPYSCSFCSVSTVFGREHRCRPVDEITKEVETFDRAKIIGFVDDNIIGNPRFAKELFCSLISYQIKWIAQCSVALASDDELLKLAAASGCIELLIGFESLSQANLTAVGKKINAVDGYEEVIRKVHAHGIASHGIFILGLDEDDVDMFERTLYFAQRMRLESAQFAWPVPYPGTALTESMDKAGRIVTKDWSQYEDTLVLEPKKMSRETLQQKRDWVWREFYTIPSIWRRLGVKRRFLVPLWVLNLSYRSSWRRKYREEKHPRAHRPQ
jgi:radical SAM superfamily enzyme YgiQ (UPF0313 family)